jgi:hypothetical protein
MSVNSMLHDMRKVENYLLGLKAAMLEAVEDGDCIGEGCGDAEGDEGDEDEEDAEADDAEDEEE